MPDTTANNAPPGSRAVRTVADEYVHALADLDPIMATSLGLKPGEYRLPDLSPAGHGALDDLARSTLEQLTAAETAADAAGNHTSGDERRCARLLRERLNAALAMSAQGEHLREVSNIFAPPHRIRGTFLDMPAATADDWSVIARRMALVPEALGGYQASLTEGASRGLFASPKVTEVAAGQMREWAQAGDAGGWFADFAAAAGTATGAGGTGEAGAAGAAGADGLPGSLRADLGRAAAAADEAVGALARWLGQVYLPQAEGTSDGVGAERYRTCARRWTGATVDPREAYEWGWSQFSDLQEQMRTEAERVLPGASAQQAMAYLDDSGQAIEGVAEIRDWLQDLMDRTIADLNGSHFDLAEPLRTVQARIAPPGSAAAPYYTAPSQDFARPGRTWLPTLGRTRFPLWGLISTWYHEGVPGHHLQLAQWRYVSGDLSLYQTTVGGVSACSEGWALYAERLMDELGYLDTPGARLGYLDAQNLRAIRVIIDIGMHLELEIPAFSPFAAGQRWTPDLALEFFTSYSGQGREFLASEVIRYLSGPGQAISYKLGERAWLTGRAAAREAHSARGLEFDLKSWHMAALSLGSLGLDDLAEELATL
ncbi:MAG TPA: DUF885 domain-containing protein [Streptosporangiaceae bacterium]